MMNEEKDLLEEEVIETVEEEAPEESVEEVETQEEPEQNKEQNNFRELREARQKDRLRAEKAEEELQRVYSYMQQQQQPQQQEEDHLSEYGLTQEDFVEGKQFGKLNKNVSSLKKNTEAKFARMEEVLAENTLKAKYQDFDAIVTSENVGQFCKSYPELSMPIQHGDMLSRGESAYKLIKKFLINDNKVNNQKQRIQNNLRKPKSSSSVTPTRTSGPLGQMEEFVNGRMTKEYAKKLREEMDNAINSA